MSYVKDNLLPYEAIVFWHHWIICFWPVSILILGYLIVASGHSDLTPTGIAIALIGVILQVAYALKRAAFEFAVTNKRVIVKTGLIRRTSLEILLSKIESIGVGQGVLGRLLGYGTLKVGGTGGIKESFDKVAAPMSLRRKIQEQLSTGA